MSYWYRFPFTSQATRRAARRHCSASYVQHRQPDVVVMPDYIANSLIFRSWRGIGRQWQESRLAQTLAIKPVFALWKASHHPPLAPSTRDQQRLDKPSERSRIERHGRQANEVEMKREICWRSCLCDSHGVHVRPRHGQQWQARTIAPWCAHRGQRGRYRRGSCSNRLRPRSASSDRGENRTGASGTIGIRSVPPARLMVHAACPLLRNLVSPFTVANAITLPSRISSRSRRLPPGPMCWWLRRRRYPHRPGLSSPTRRKRITYVRRRRHAGCTSPWRNRASLAGFRAISSRSAAPQKC